MAIPFTYIKHNFLARKLTAVITIGGVALVVFVFAAVLMMAYGVEKALIATGSEQNGMVTRKGSNNEISSIITRETNNELLTLPGIAKGPDGQPLVSAEMATVINMELKKGGMSNISLRGVGNQVLNLRPMVKLTQGRMFTFGSREMVAGVSVSKRFMGANIGERVKFSGDFWTIVGIMDTDGSAFDSELWADIDQLQQASKRSAYSSMTFKFNSKDELEKMKSKIAGDPRLNQMEVETEREFFEKQSVALAMFLRVLGLIVTIIFSVGAMIGAMITMYSAVANRVQEIGTLRALGFRRFVVLTVFLIESLLLSLSGGVIGLALASFLSFFSLSTLNFGSFSELAFSFALSPSIILISLVFALAMGFAGGFLPSWRASRLKIVDALRGV